MSDRRRDGPKPSFSELDKLRRERKQRGSEPDRSTRQTSSYAQKSYRAALERAFDSGKLAEFAATMQRKRDPQGTPPRSGPGPNPDPTRDPPGPDSDQAQQGAGHGEVPAAAGPDTGRDAQGDPPAQEPAVEPAAPPLIPRSSERAERRRLAKKIAEATSPREVAKAVDRYLARFDGLPDDYDILERLLSHPKPALVLRALETLEACIAKQKPRRSRSLSVQLSILEETHEDSDVCELAARVRAAL